MTDSTSQQWSTTDVARELGISTSAVRTYRARGTFPEPAGRVGRTPWWRPEDVRAWQASRPGQGWRKGVRK